MSVNYTVCEIFEALSDPSRLRVFFILSISTKELTEKALCVILKVKPYNLSRQLKKLKESGIISQYRKGRFVFSIVELDFINIKIMEIINFIRDTQMFKEDTERLLDYMKKNKK